MTSTQDGPLFITTDAVGGVWSYSLALARGLAAQGRSCVLAVLGPAPADGQCAEVSRINRCTLIHTGLPLEWMLAGRAELDPVVAKLIGMAADCRALAAHLHAPALACQPWPMPVVAVAHSCIATWWDAVRGGPPPREIQWHATATRQGLLAADAVVAPSKAFAAVLRDSYHLSRHVHIVHNGLPEPEPYPCEREPFILVAGRLWDPAKNIRVLDDAAAMLRLPIRAAGPLSEPGGPQTCFQNLEVLGVLAAKELGRLMARAAIFASPSLYEPFGLAVLEAAQRGTPLVLSDLAIFRELWADAALFVPADDAAGWASAFNSLLDDAGLRQRLGRAALARSRHYSLGAMTNATIAVHQALATGAQRAA